MSNNLPSNHQYIVIGDVHGCIDELKTLLAQNGFKTNPHDLLSLTAENQQKSIILLGDFIDKASEKKLQETLEFIYNNYKHLNKVSQRFYLILGNHEEMVYRYIIKDPSLKITKKSIENKKKYYNTVELLEKNSFLKKIFLELYNFSKPWLYYSYDQDFSITLTHAPCPECYLRESDEFSQKQMIKCVSRSKNPKLKLDELIPYVHLEAQETKHYHIFGHLSQPNIRKYKNKICIDTSAIYGNSLSCAIIKDKNLEFDSTPFQNKQESASQTYNCLFDFH